MQRCMPLRGLAMNAARASAARSMQQQTTMTVLELQARWRITKAIALCPAQLNSCSLIVPLANVPLAPPGVKVCLQVDPTSLALERGAADGAHQRIGSKQHEGGDDHCEPRVLPPHVPRCRPRLALERKRLLAERVGFRHQQLQPLSPAEHLRVVMVAAERSAAGWLRSGRAPSTPG